MYSHNTDPPAEVVGMYVVGILPGVASYIVELACTISLGSIDICKMKHHEVSSELSQAHLI
jgi:hypothetical protein